MNFLLNLWQTDRSPGPPPAPPVHKHQKSYYHNQYNRIILSYHLSLSQCPIESPTFLATPILIKDSLLASLPLGMIFPQLMIDKMILCHNSVKFLIVIIEYLISNAVVDYIRCVEQYFFNGNSAISSLRTDYVERNQTEYDKLYHDFVFK